MRIQSPSERTLSFVDHLVQPLHCPKKAVACPRFQSSQNALLQLALVMLVLQTKHGARKLQPGDQIQPATCFCTAHKLKMVITFSESWENKNQENTFISRCEKLYKI